jgi:hypothetical protein
MKRPSRLMPAYEPERISTGKKVAAYSFLIIMLVVLIYAGWNRPLVLAVLVALAGYGVFSSWKHRRKLMKLAEYRENESICTFAKAFGRKQVDTWIIRAVHEELQKYVKIPNGTCPLSATDNLENDLEIDPDDIEELIPIVAQRTGRNLEHTENNPYYGKIVTVGDFVLFINCQPKITP